MGKLNARVSSENDYNNNQLIQLGLLALWSLNQVMELRSKVLSEPCLKDHPFLYALPILFEDNCAV